ncbi:hypothetical protein N7492_008524 [Penicillium capsulatum]|uniref:Secreted protein n=1 Tax=Penicillium capsulatum TaxID=69766 RepID=A0A9W9HTM8_9EURO|nr:hypothetical protein N7492_008524 [Penicillium capsulatum]KAJ6105927.1 hypothetical protein N7512_009444 [Penicillium capsulatum]
MSFPAVLLLLSSCAPRWAVPGRGGVRPSTVATFRGRMLAGGAGLGRAVQYATSVLVSFMWACTDEAALVFRLKPGPSKPNPMDQKLPGLLEGPYSDDDGGPFQPAAMNMRRGVRRSDHALITSD